MSRFRCLGCVTSLDLVQACPGHDGVETDPEDWLVCRLCCPHCQAETAAAVEEVEGTIILSFTERDRS